MLQNGPLLLGFFFSLCSINTLKCHPRFLWFLLGISNGVDVVLPLLRTLKFDDLNVTDDDRSFILPFISRRVCRPKSWISRSASGWWGILAI
ncbi:hypothetical protein BDZ97DRAFT_982957 [Flammula alnicola]|nr:hypothetical protein BDZ97DRAFT_982957 [Flammula alnicola]